jgi:hypothetical protein
MGNTFGSSGFSSGSSLRFHRQISQITVHEGDERNVVAHLCNADSLRSAEIGFCARLVFVPVEAPHMVTVTVLSWNASPRQLGVLRLLAFRERLQGVRPHLTSSVPITAFPSQAPTRSTGSANCIKGGGLRDFRQFPGPSRFATTQRHVGGSSDAMCSTPDRQSRRRFGNIPRCGDTVGQFCKPMDTIRSGASLILSLKRRE